MDTDPQTPTPEDRLQWLGVIGSGLIAALITAIAMPPAQDTAPNPPPPASVQTATP
ncbi:MAG TPA: hypothetical protein VF169_27165 [Albitalea sp.]|uniref:hypothetical protein n=1 Tax=Piscinibacter sp. TaxID=1903157 RepID=UPI002ED53FA1